MLSSALHHGYIFLTVLFTVYGQLVLKWQVSLAGVPPADTLEKTAYLLKLLFNPWVISGFLAAFLAALSWMLAMARFDLSYAYPFMSLAFVLVLMLSGVIFGEAVTLPKVVGLALIVGGIVLSSQG